MNCIEVPKFPFDLTGCKTHSIVTRVDKLCELATEDNNKNASGDAASLTGVEKLFVLLPPLSWIAFLHKQPNTYMIGFYPSRVILTKGIHFIHLYSMARFIPNAHPSSEEKNKATQASCIPRRARPGIINIKIRNRLLLTRGHVLAGE